MPLEPPTPEEVVAASWYATLFQRALAETNDLGEALLAADLAYEEQPVNREGVVPTASTAKVEAPAPVAVRQPRAPRIYSRRLDRDQLDLDTSFFADDMKFATERKVGEKWQGPSGRWFTRRPDGRVVPWGEGKPAGPGRQPGKAQEGTQQPPGKPQGEKQPGGGEGAPGRPGAAVAGKIDVFADSLGRRMCYSTGKRIACPRPGKGEPGLVPTERPTVEGVQTVVKSYIAEGLDEDKVAKIGTLLGNMLVKDLQVLRKGMNAKWRASKADLIDSIKTKVGAPRKSNFDVGPSGKTDPLEVIQPKQPRLTKQSQVADARLKEATDNLKDRATRLSFSEAGALARKVFEGISGAEQQKAIDRWGLYTKEEIGQMPEGILRRHLGRSSTPRPRSEAEWRAHPALAELGDKLSIKDIDHPEVQKHLEHLSAVPSKLMKDVVIHGLSEVAVGNASMTGLDKLQYLAGTTPRGWSPGQTWDAVAGGYDQGRRVVVAGVGKHACASLVLHEYGHAIGQCLDLDNSQELIEHHKRILDKLPPYFKQDGPGGLAGRQEILAEGFASVMIDRERAVEEFDEAFVQWLEDTVVKPYR